MISQSGSKVTEFQSQGCFGQTQSPEIEAVFLLGVTLLQYYQNAWAFSLPLGCPILMIATALISPTYALDIGGNCFLPFLYLSVMQELIPAGYCQFHLISKIFMWSSFVHQCICESHPCSIWRLSISLLDFSQLVTVSWIVCATLWTSALFLWGLWWAVSLPPRSAFLKMSLGTQRQGVKCR